MGKKVLAFGAFDLLHLGHLFYLKKAKKLGSELVVVVARDQNIKKDKKQKPVKKEKERLKIVQALKPVDKALLGYKRKNRIKIIKKIKPEVIALGHDQRISKQKIKQYLKKSGIKAKVVRLPAFKRKKYSSSKKRKKLMLGIEKMFD